MRTTRRTRAAAVIALLAAVAAPAGAVTAEGPALSPGLDAQVSGSQTVRATPTGEDAVTSLTLAGAQVGAPTLGEGVSRLVFDGNHIESSYSNYLLINGEWVGMGIHQPLNEFVEVEVEIDNQLLVEGSNAIRLGAGTRPTGCGQNHDDFQLRNVRLVLSDGSEHLLSGTDPILIGDGSCGSNAGKARHVDLGVELDVEPRGAQGRLAVVDTTVLPDGPVEVVATAESGAATIQTMTVDNRAPQVVATVPADGDHVTGDVELAVTLEDLTGLGEVAITLDGVPVVQGDVLSARALPEGAHTLEVTAADVLGNVSTTVTTFTSERPADGSTGPEIITPADGTTITATSTVIARPARALDGVESLTVAGETVEARPTLGSGTSTLTIEGSDLEQRYGNHLVLNGTRLPLDLNTVRHPNFSFFDVEVPNELLVTGRNQLRVAPGAVQAACGANLDDFQVRNVSLELPDGSVVEIAGPQNLLIGDGSCGSNATKPRFADLPFDVETAAESGAGMLYVLDSTEHEDGPLELGATAASGATSSVALTVDNTGPEITSSVPAHGDELVGTATLDVRLWDLSGVAEPPVVALDGEPVELGAELVGAELVGPHELSVTAVDTVGNTSTSVVEFTGRASARPDVPTELRPAAGSTGHPSHVELSALVSDPAGGLLTATFREGSQAAPTAGFHGQASSLPARQLDVPGQEELSLDGLGDAGGRGLESVSTPEVAYQRFDLPVEDRDAGRHEVVWSGWVDPDRSVRLEAWNVRYGEWFELASTRGSNEVTALQATVGATYVDGDVVHVRVVGTDPFADDLEGTPDTSFRDPDSYDFSLVHTTDTQYLTHGAVAEDTEEEREMFRSSLLEMNRWIVDNADERKIAYVAHSGDLAESNMYRGASPELVEQAHAEFALASEAHRIIEDAGIPTGVLAGNHDNQYGNEVDGDLFNGYFGPDRFHAASAEASQDYYGGPWREGDNQNHYDLFSAGGLDFVAVYLSYAVSPEEIAWADEVLRRYADRNAIIVAHAYLAPSRASDGRGDALSLPDGRAIVDGLTTRNPNVVLTLSGHETGVSINVRRDASEPGHHVVELLADYQSYLVDGYRLGSSYLRLLQFDVDDGVVTVDTYSPYLDDFGTDEHDIVPGRYDGREDQFSIPVDLTSRMTSFTTTGIALVTLEGDVIGSVEVASGERAAVTWSGLAPAQAHAWYVTVENAAGLTSTSPLARLTTEPRSPEITTQPTSPGQVRPGTVVPLTVDAPSGTGFQWQRQLAGTWTDLVGATASSYEVRAVPPLDGARYRVLVHGDPGTPPTVSDEVVLDVRPPPGRPSSPGGGRR